MSAITIERVGEKGDGLAQGNAYPRSLAGETFDTNGQRLTNSSGRIAAFCPVFETCGGCKLQHWQHEPYAAWKRELLVAALKTRGLAPAVAPLIDAHGAGRRRVTLHVRQVQGRWCAGFMAEASHTLVPIESCPIVVPRLKEAPQLAATFGPYFGACDVSVTAADNGLDIAIKAERKMAERALAPFGVLMREKGVARVAVNGETTAQLVVPLLRIGKSLVSLPVGGFLQATAEGESILARLVLDHALKFRNVADLFCGVGPFALRLAETHAVNAFDSHKASIAALQSAARNTQGIKPLTSTVRDLFRDPLTVMELKEFGAVVLDPPRAGAEAQCAHLAKSAVKCVIYASCDAQTFARDAAMLAAGGYVMQNVIPVDQFKYSAHLECVGVFQRP